MSAESSADIICSEKRTVFRERSSRKTVSFKEQIMSKDDSALLEAHVLLILCNAKWWTKFYCDSYYYYWVTVFSLPKLHRNTSYVC